MIRTAHRGHPLRTAAAFFFLFVLTSVWSAAAIAQTPSLSNGVPSESFAGEQFCFDASWTNTGGTGFGPYIRLILPPDISFDSASFLGTAVTASGIGTFPTNPNNQLTDPRSDTEITGPAGGNLTLLVLPLGSVVTGGAEIVTNVCATISTDATIGDPLDVTVQPVYEFGDTATGANGPIDGAANTRPVTPTLIVASKSQNAPESERPPGPSFEYEYQFTVDVANGQTVQNIQITDTLPPDVQYVGPITVTGGVGETIDSEPSDLSPGGLVQISFDSITGTSSDSDVTVSFPVYIVDTLDETSCGVEAQINALTVDADFEGSSLPQITDNTTVTAKHFAIQKSVAPGTVRPGDTVTFTVNFQLTEFGTATDLVLTDVLQDGFTFQSHTGFEIGGSTSSITPIEAVDPIGGITTLTYDIGAAVTGDIVGPTTGFITYTATVDELYKATGLPVNALDTIGSNVTATYSLSNGAPGCTDSSSAGVSIQGTSISKTIVNPQPEYMPGEVVTFGLTKTIPSGDTKNVVFEDFFPLPVLDVTSIVVGTDIRVVSGPPNPTISVDGTTNSLKLDFGDVASNASQTIEIEVDIAIVDEPFADGLFSTNLFQSSNSNTPGEVATAATPVQLNVRAPDFQITKGIAAVDNSNAAISPSPAVTPVDGDLSDADAGDTVTFEVFVENVGGATAFDVAINDGLPAGFTNLANVSTSQSGGVTGIVNTSSGAALDIDVATMPAGSTLTITYTADLANDVSPEQSITNTAGVVWASQLGATLFPEVTDDAVTTIAAGSLAKSIDSVSPDAASPDVTAGDSVTYRITVTLPEGEVDALSISDALPAGFEFQSAVLDATGFAGSVSLVSAIASGTVGSGQTVDISFGSTTTVTSDNNAANNSFAVTVTALVRGTAASNDGLPSTQSKVNTASLDYTGQSGTISDTATTDFAEPKIQLTKTMSPDSGLDAGDTVTITLLIENTGTAPAYDLEVTDTLNDSGTLFDLTTVSEGSTPAGYSYVYANPTVSYTGSGSLAAGSSATFTFTAQVNALVQTGSSFDNNAGATADSQDGTVTGERTTSDSASDTVTTSAPDVSKILIATSEAWTSDTAPIEAAIGEILTYEASFEIPEGLTFTPTVTPIITDTLPAGQAYIDGTALVRVENVDTGLSATNHSAFGATNVSVDVASINVNGQVLEFNLGGFTNNDSDADTERLVLTYDVLVENTSDNNRTDAKTNSAALNYLNRAGTEQSVSDGLTLNIAEPNLVLTKTASPATVTGGSEVTFTIVANNASNTNVTRAWGPVISDTLPARYQNVALTSATLSRGAVDVSGCNVISGNTVTLTTATCLAATEAYLDPDDTITLVLTADVDPTIEFNEQVTNTATVAASSLPGTNGTGDATPGTPGDANGERTGSGVDENDLSATGSATVTANQPSISKSGSISLQVGETTTMTLTVDLPVGTTSSFVVTDDLPAGLRYTGSPIAITTPVANFTATNSPSTSPAAETDPLVFDFGNITNSAAVTQTITIDYEVQVENVLGNQNLTALTNTASLSFTGASPSISDTATVTVVEPNLEISKSITSGAAGSDAGDTIGYQVAIQNSSTVGTAYQVDLRDVLPAELLGAPDGSGTAPFFRNIGVTNPGGAVVLNATNTPLDAAAATFATTTLADDTLTWPLFDLPPNTTLTITYDAVVTNTAPAGAMLINDVSAAYHSLEDGGAAGRDGSNNGDDDTDDVLNNYNETDSVTLNLSTDIEIQKSLNAAQPSNDFTIGDLVTFDLRVDLIEGTTSNVVVADVLPAGLSFEGPISIVATPNISYTGAGTAVESPAGTLTIDLGNITNVADDNTGNDFLVIEVDARVIDVIDNEAGDTITNSASLTSDLGPAGPDTVDIDIVEPVLAVTKVPNNEVPALGETVTWTITVQHQPSSGTDAFDVLLVDVIPAGLTYVSGSHAGDGTVDESNTAAPEFDLGSITLVDTSKTFTFDTRVDLDAAVGSPITNGIGLGWDGQSSAPTVERSYTGSGSGEVTPATPALIDAQKTVAIVVDGGTSNVVDPGDTLEYTVTLANTGPAVTNSVFTDALPTQTTYVANSLTSSQGTTHDSAAPDLSVDLGTLAESATVTITFRVTVNGGTPEGTIISNQGLVDSDQTVPEPTDVDGLDANGDQPTTIPVGGTSPVTEALYALKGVDLVSDNDSSGSVTPNDTLEYFFVLVNEGPETLTGVTLDDALPAGLTYVAASAAVSPASGNVNVVGASVEASFPSIEVGGTALVSFQVTVNDPLVDLNGGANDEIFVNQAVVDSDQTDPVRSDSNGDPSDGNQPTSIQAVDSGQGTPSIDVEKRWSQGSDLDGDGLVDPGDQITYSIIVTNTGSAAATNLRLTDLTPVNTSFVAGSSSTSQGVVVAEDPLSVNIGALDPGGFMVIGFRVDVDGGTPDGTIIANQANVTADGGISENSDDNGRDADGINPTLTPVDTGGGSAAGTPGGLSKSLVSSSESGSSGLNAQIGEVLTYQLGVKLPAGTLREVTLTDTLPTGLRYVPGSARLARVFDTGLITSRNPGGINEAASETSLPLTDGDDLITSGNVIEVFLGDVINSDNDINDEQILLQIDVVTENIAANQAGTTLTNQGSLRFFNQLGQPQILTPVSVTATVVEPQVEITKSASPLAITTVGGDVEYTLAVTNPSGAFAATAYDLQVTDLLPTQAGSLTIQSITPAGGAAGITDNTAGTTVDLALATLPPNGSITIVYTATYPAPQAAGSVENSANITWTSLPGSQGTVSATPGNPGDANGERTGSGIGANDYSDIDTALVTIGGLSLDKSVVNPQSRYAIGDTIDYQVEVAVPPGLNLIGTTLSDVLDPGLEYVTGTFSLALDAGLAITNTPTDFSRTEGVPGPGEETLSVNFGTVSSSASGMKLITLRYSALVENVLSNQDNQSLDNEITLSIADTGAGVGDSLTDTTSNTVGEPRLALNKSLTSPTTGLEAGDTVSFVVTVANTGATTAFETVLSDMLPAGLVNIAELRVTAATGGAQTPAFTNSGMDWESTPFDLPPGASVSIAFDAGLAVSVLPGAVIQNQVGAKFSSRVNEDPNERDGSEAGTEQDDGNLNNYNVAASAPSFTVNDPVQIDKGFYPDPASNRYTIGEQLTYRLTVRFIEGTLADLVLVDDLPSTVRFESAMVSFGNLGMVAEAVPTGEVAGNTVTFDFGDLTNPPNGNAADDFLTVDLRVTVLDAPANVNTAVIGNNASLTFTGPDGLKERVFDADAVTPGIQPLEFTVIEPDLQVLKMVAPNAPAPGALLRYSLVLDHTVASTVDAFDLQVVDTLPDGVTYVPGSASPAPSNIAGQTLTFEIAALTLLADQTEITYEATVDAGQEQDAALTNVASLAYSTIPGVEPDERGYFAGGEATVTVSDQAPDLTLIKDDAGTSVSPGGGVTYTLSYANVGPLAATGVVITETVPENTRFNQTTSTENWNCAPDLLPGATCTFELGSLAQGASGSLLFGLVVDTTIPAGVSAIANSAQISDDGTGGFDLNPADNSTSDTTPLIAAPDLTLVKDDGGVTTVPDGVVVYTLSYANVGDQGATGVTLTDTVPANTSFEAAASSSGWFCAPDASAGSTCTLALGTIPAGTVSSATLALRIDDPLPVAVSQVDNNATIGDDGSNGVDPTPNDNEDSDVTPVNNDPELAVDKVLTLVPDEVEVGSVLEYTITAENAGNATLNNVTIVDNMITRTGGTAPCTSVAQGATCTLIGEYVVTQNDIDSGSILNVATGDSDQTAPVEDQVDLPIAQEPAIDLVKLSDAEGALNVNDEVVYTITATNTGNVTLANVLLTDEMIELACDPELPATLLPGTTLICTGSYIVQQSDIGRQLLNTAIVTGQSSQNPSVTVESNDEVTITVVNPIPVPLNGRYALLLLVLGLLAIAATYLRRRPSHY